MNNLTDDQMARLCTNLAAAIAEQDRLRALSNHDLIIECLEHDSADDPYVEELVNCP